MGRSPASGCEKRVCITQKVAKTKIRQFDRLFIVNQDVVGLEVSVNDANNVVEVVQDLNKLTKPTFCPVFINPLCDFEAVFQGSVTHIFEDQDKVLVIFGRFINSDNVGV